MQKDNIVLDNKTILITGTAGFIGANLAVNLFNKYKTIKIIGLDNILKACCHSYDNGEKRGASGMCFIFFGLWLQ